MERPRAKEIKVCLNCCGRVNKMAMMPIYGGNFKISSSPEPSTIRFMQMMGLCKPSIF